MNESTHHSADAFPPFAFIPATNHAAVTDSDSSVVSRVEQTLEQLDLLQELMAKETDYGMEPLPFEVPSDFLLSIVVPVYNERQTVSRLLARVHALPVPHELIVVDDCSSDGTVDVLRELTLVPAVKVIFKTVNEGKGAALRTGFEQAAGDIVIIQDADLEYDPRDIPRLLRPIIEGQADVVYGSRFMNQSQHAGSSWIHQWGNRLLTATSNAFTGLELTDMETCYKAFRRDMLRDLPLRQDRFGFEPEITAKVARRDARVVELPIRYQARDWTRGKKIGVRDAINAFYCIVRYAFFD